jgi:hypothetical protein
VGVLESEFFVTFWMFGQFELLSTHGQLTSRNAQGIFFETRVRHSFSFCVPPTMSAGGSRSRSSGGGGEKKRGRGQAGDDDEWTSVCMDRLAPGRDKASRHAQKARAALVDAATARLARNAEYAALCERCPDDAVGAFVFGVGRA